jgi:hypothetical protein
MGIAICTGSAKATISRSGFVRKVGLHHEKAASLIKRLGVDPPIDASGNQMPGVGHRQAASALSEDSRIKTGAKQVYCLGRPSLEACVRADVITLRH